MALDTYGTLQQKQLREFAMDLCVLGPLWSSASRNLEKNFLKGPRAGVSPHGKWPPTPINTRNTRITKIEANRDRVGGEYRARLANPYEHLTWRYTWIVPVSRYCAPERKDSRKMNVMVKKHKDVKKNVFKHLIIGKLQKLYTIWNSNDRRASPGQG